MDAHGATAGVSRDTGASAWPPGPAPALELPYDAHEAPAHDPLWARRQAKFRRRRRRRVQLAAALVEADNEEVSARLAFLLSHELASPEFAEELAHRTRRAADSVLFRDPAAECAAAPSRPIYMQPPLSMREMTRSFLGMVSGWTDDALSESGDAAADPGPVPASHAHAGTPLIDECAADAAADGDGAGKRMRASVSMPQLSDWDTADNSRSAKLISRILQFRTTTHALMSPAHTDTGAARRRSATGREGEEEHPAYAGHGGALGLGVADADGRRVGETDAPTRVVALHGFAAAGRAVDVDAVRAAPSAAADAPELGVRPGNTPRVASDADGGAASDAPWGPRGGAEAAAEGTASAHTGDTARRSATPPGDTLLPASSPHESFVPSRVLRRAAAKRRRSSGRRHSLAASGWPGEMQSLADDLVHDHPQYAQGGRVSVADGSSLSTRELQMLDQGVHIGSDASDTADATADATADTTADTPQQETSAAARDAITPLLEQHAAFAEPGVKRWSARHGVFKGLFGRRRHRATVSDLTQLEQRALDVSDARAGAPAQGAPHAADGERGADGLQGVDLSDARRTPNVPESPFPEAAASGGRGAEDASDGGSGVSRPGVRFAAEEEQHAYDAGTGWHDIDANGFAAAAADSSYGADTTQIVHEPEEAGGHAHASATDTGARRSHLPSYIIVPTPLQGSVHEDEGWPTERFFTPCGAFVVDDRGVILPSQKSLADGCDALDEGPVLPPFGMGRRVLYPSTALFRNVLTRRAWEQEGWGWEKYTDARAHFAALDADDDDSDDEVPLMNVRIRHRDAALAEKRTSRLRRRRRRRRRLCAPSPGSVRARSAEDAAEKGGSASSAGEPPSSSSTCDSSDETDAELPWVDDRRPAGLLYGQSLVDMAAETKRMRRAQVRFYGHDNAAPDGADGTFYNDTRARMEKVFSGHERWRDEWSARAAECRDASAEGGPASRSSDAAQESGVEGPVIHPTTDEVAEAELRAEAARDEAALAAWHDTSDEDTPLLHAEIARFSSKPRWVGDDEDDTPLERFRHSLPPRDAGSDSDDAQPLGSRHPQAALIKQLTEENRQVRMELQMLNAMRFSASFPASMNMMPYVPPWMSAGDAQGAVDAPATDAAFPKQGGTLVDGDTPPWDAGLFPGMPYAPSWGPDGCAASVAGDAPPAPIVAPAAYVPDDDGALASPFEHGGDGWEGWKGGEGGEGEESGVGGASAVDGPGDVGGPGGISHVSDSSGTLHRPPPPHPADELPLPPGFDPEAIQDTLPAFPMAIPPDDEQTDAPQPTTAVPSGVAHPAAWTADSVHPSLYEFFGEDSG
ncbi:hypothetical protein MSPP1_001993 [Malassezia sp. CBS 17886]|nr:hypothetical protein MSPP1_001993 [Malassezia sp. CBS 17886]